MSLRDRLQQSGANARHGGGAGFGPAQGPTGPIVQNWEHQKGEQFDAVKSAAHSQVVDAMTQSQGRVQTPTDVATLATQVLNQYLEREKIPMSLQERQLVVDELVVDILGLGPLEQLLRDPTISDILVNGPKNVYVERFGCLEKSSVQFKDNAHLINIIERIVSAVGRRVDEKTPMVDARLKDGSRVNAIIPPLAIDGPSLSIRKFKADAGTLEKLLAWGSMTPEMANVLNAAVLARLNIVISGGTGAGKTTLLNSLSAVIPEDERIVTIEDSAELQLKQDHLVRLETRPPNIEGEGEIAARHLLMNALRMRPDRIIVGECRGGETLDMLQAMNTGHDGSLTTLHANTPRDAVSRIVTMCMMNPAALPEKTLKQQMSSAVHLIVQASRLQDGSRKVTSITELTGLEGDVVTMQEIFKFQQEGIDANGKVIGYHVATGIRPRFEQQCKEKGVPLLDQWFTVNKAQAAEHHNPGPPSGAGQTAASPVNPAAVTSGLPAAGAISPSLQERLRGRTP
jgi:pilus assembly protein CpaF